MIDLIELQKNIITEYSNGKTCYEIGKKFDIYTTVVSFMLKAADIKVKHNVFKPKPKIDLPVEEIKRLYVDEHWEIVELEIEFNVSSGTIVKRLKEVGVKLRGYIPISNQFTPETIKRLYWDENLTFAEIGKKYNCSGQTIGNYMRKHNIPIKSGGRTKRVK